MCPFSSDWKKKNRWSCTEIHSTRGCNCQKNFSFHLKLILSLETHFLPLKKGNFKAFLAALLPPIKYLCSTHRAHINERQRAFRRIHLKPYPVCTRQSYFKKLIFLAGSAFILCRGHGCAQLWRGWALGVCVSVCVHAAVVPFFSKCFTTVGEMDETQKKRDNK